MAHVGAVAILLAFGVLHGGAAAGHAGYAFSAMREAPLSNLWASVAFFLAFVGFGAKAGMLPLHIWLPDAHPAAPTPVSALMSGVMLKTAIYGMVRITYDLIGQIQWHWGLVVLLVGTATALFGVLYALMQHDLKRLLAYHSVENIGIILIGLGLSLLFFGTGHPLPGALGLVAALYHTLNHAVFKGLLFLGAGSVLHATEKRDLNAMGGLIHRMPHTALYFLTGALAISALPPLNGFISEWLTFQTALQAFTLEHSGLRSLIPLAAAILALSGALTAMCFVKVYGITFLGKPRQIDLDTIHEIGTKERMGMAWLAAGCILLGLFPLWLVRPLSSVSQALTGQGLTLETLSASWLWLIPVSSQQASYSPVIFFLLSWWRWWRSRSSRCAASIMAACAGPTPGIVALPPRRRACRIRLMPSASRSGMSLPLSSSCTGACLRPMTPRRASSSRSKTATGAGSINPSPAWWRPCPSRLGGSSTAASPSIFCTVLPP
jgi:formate hydrogenlyase subunit 3/multisubunit Na+/H+ antiporter MnhD subunit